MTDLRLHSPDDDQPSPLAGVGLLVCPDETTDAIYRAIEQEKRSGVLYRIPRWVAPLATAAVLAIAFAGVWLAARSTAPEYSDAELQAIAADLRYVFGSAGDALVRGQEAALDDVLSRRVAPAVQQAPIGLSQPSSRDQGSNGL